MWRRAASVRMTRMRRAQLLEGALRPVLSKAASPSGCGLQGGGDARVGEEQTRGATQWEPPRRCRVRAGAGCRAFAVESTARRALAYTGVAASACEICA